MKNLMISTLILLFTIFGCTMVDGQLSTLGSGTDSEDTGTVTKTVDPSSFSWSGFTDTNGGTDGEVIRVTNLNNSGPGSFRHAVEDVTGPRLVVFEVGGVIDLEWTPLRISNPNITIAGQTAPSPGITLIKGDIRIGTNDVIIEHLILRLGDTGSSFDAIQTVNANARDVIIRNCSLSWTTDETLSASGPPDGETSRRISFINNIISEPLGTNGGRGTLIHNNVKDVLIAGNLYAHSSRRNPMLKHGAEAAIVNNLLYNIKVDPMRFNTAEDPGNPGRASIVSNILWHGPDTWHTRPLIKISESGEAYLEDNKAIKIDGSEGDIHTPDFFDPLTVLNEKPAWPNGLIPIPVEEVTGFVLETAGARPWDRDPIDQRVIDDVKNKTGNLIDSISEVGGYPDYPPTFRTLSVPETNRKEWLRSLEKGCAGSKECS